MDNIVTEETASDSNDLGASIRFSASEWLLLLVLASVQFTHIVDFMMIMPLGRQFIEKMSLSPGEFGLIVSAYTVSAGLASLLAARFLDRFDRKSALLFLYAGFAVGTLLCAASQNYFFLVAARAVAGGFGGVAGAVVLAIVGDAFPDSRRGRATGVIMSAFSMATILGVPLGLECAEFFGWQAPFVVLGIFSVLVLVVAIRILPPLRGHIDRKHPEVTVSAIAVALDPNHIRAFLLMLGLVFSSFIIVPFIPTFIQMNVGIAESHVKYIYLCGGLTTLVTLPWIGRLADLRGKLPVFRIIAAACVIPFLAITNLWAGAGLPLVILGTTLMFVTTSGRMVPAMALITNSAEPRIRGSFMSLNSAVQQLGAGLAAWMGGLLLHQAEDKTLVGYPLTGILASLFAVSTVFLAGRLRPAPGAATAPDEAIAEHFLEGVSTDDEPEPEGVAAGHR